MTCGETEDDWHNDNEMLSFIYLGEEKVLWFRKLCVGSTSRDFMAKA